VSDDIERILIELAQAGVDFERSALGDEHFQRVITFALHGVTHRIVWWTNQRYLSIGGNHANYIPFTMFRNDTCWPDYRAGFRVTDGDHDVAYLAVEKLPWQEGRS
jgi:hypothetical protein